MWVAAKSHDHSLSFSSQAGKPVCHSRFEVSNEIIEPRWNARALTHIQRWRVRRPVTEPPLVCVKTQPPPRVYADCQAVTCCLPWLPVWLQGTSLRDEKPKRSIGLIGKTKQNKKKRERLERTWRIISVLDSDVRMFSYSVT